MKTLILALAVLMCSCVVGGDSFDDGEPIAVAFQPLTSEADCIAMGADACTIRLIGEMGERAMHLSHSAKMSGWYSPPMSPACGPGRPGRGALLASRMNNETARVYETVCFGDVYLASVLTQVSLTRPGYVVVKDEESLAYDFKGDVLPP